MDKTGIIVVTLCAILMGVWLVEENKYYTHLPPPSQNTNAVAASQTPMTVSNTASPAPLAIPDLSFDTNAPEQTIVLTNGQPHREWVRYTFTSRGGGLKQVELLDYPATISARWKKQNAGTTNGVATLNAGASAPVLAVLGDAGLIGDGNFTLTQTADGVRAEKAFANGLQIVKEFHLGSNYLINTSVRLENVSGKPLALPAQEFIVGTATPMDVDDSGQVEGAMWFNGASVNDSPLSWFSGSGISCVRGAPRAEYRGGATNVVWAAAHNQFFALMAMTRPNEPAEQIVARPVTLPAFVQAPGAALPQGVQTALVYPAQMLPANQAVERQIVLFAGPKEYRRLAVIGDEFQNHADLIMQFGFFGFFAKALLLAMNWLHDVTTLGYGLVIVLITVIIKLIFWPLTAASTRSMKRMQALAPEVNALKEKYKDDPQKFTQKQWELWKKNKVSPMGGCLPMLIQTPVFIGFFTMIRSAIELRGAHFLWASDLSKPDTLFTIPGTEFPFNLLPLLMGAVMVWQAHLQPPSPGMDAAQAKLMRYMPLVILIFLYNYSAGMALYMTVSNLLSILQMKVTKSNQPVAAVAISPLTPISKKKK
jgi:YidC/Oxa1 family membrane protein insertase